MTYRVEILPSAQRELAVLSSKEQKRINERIGRLVELPRPPGVTVLQGKKDTYYRARVGDYPHHLPDQRQGAGGTGGQDRPPPRGLPLIRSSMVVKIVVVSVVVRVWEAEI